MKQDLTQKFLDLAGVMFVALNTKGEITLINKKGCEILGYEESELIGRNWFDTCIPGHNREDLKLFFNRLLKREIGVAKYFENPVLTKSGNERLLSWHNTMIIDEKGKPIGTLSSGLDMTEHKRAEEIVVENETRLRAILDTAVDGIITINDRGIIESVNKAVERLFGYRAHELLGQNVKILMSGADKVMHDRYLANYIKTGSKKIIGIGREVVGCKKNGKIFPLHISVSEFFLGSERKFTGIVHDLTEQKSLQEKILQTERLAIIGKMAAKVAHEVRNPLSSVSLNAELLEDEIQNYESSDNEEAKSLIKSMIQEIDRVTSMTDEYLQFSRLPESSPERETFKTVIDEIVEFLGNELKQKNIELVFKDSNPPQEVLLDRTQFRRVLINLMRNAIESMPTGGVLKVWTKKNERFGVLFIQDTGVGIPEDKVDHIFEPFFTTKDFGTGLGLAITQQIILEHGGQIYCKSKVNVGTTLKIEIPLAEVS
ncbi:MAG: PAS domain S-box protein [bacterium]